LHNLKAENQQLKVKCRNLRLNLAALERKIGFFHMSDKKKGQEVSSLKKEIAQLKKLRKQKK